MPRLKKKIRLIFIAMVVCFFRLISYPFQSKTWVFCERGTDARDNAYWFYRFIKDNYPTQKLCFIIERDSADYDKVKEDAVILGSLKSFWALATAEKLISTHYGTGLPVYNLKIYKLFGLHKKLCFLQHGITKDDIIALYKDNAPMRLFICGAKPEYDFVLKNFGHDAETVKYTGLARFDQLYNIEVKKQVLVMPTWRNYINTEKEFLQSEYFEKWCSFLGNPELMSWLESNDMELVVYLHYELQKYTHCFPKFQNRIKLARFEDYDVQTLLKESAVLITDYSSVFFDFAYMKKPVLFYQFDESTFFGRHYKKGYFEYREMGLGDVCVTAEELIEGMHMISAHKMQAEKKYIERAEKFFPLHDNNNCRRIYSAIVGERNE